MPVPPLFSQDQVTRFFGHHLWMAHYSADRVETLQRDAGKDAASCRQLTSKWMDSVRVHETETFDAVMRLHAPNGFRSLPDVFRNWDIPRLGRLLETVENRATFQRFGLSVRDMEWPWRWKKRLTRYELIPLLQK